MNNCFILLVILTLCVSCEDIEPPSKMSVEKGEVYQKHFRRQKQKYNLEPWMVGGGGSDMQYNLMSIGLNCKYSLTIEAARGILVESVFEFLREVNESKTLKPYLIDYPFTQDKIEYSIHVKNKNKTWPTFPKGFQSNRFISYIVLGNNEIRYMIKMYEKKLPVEVHCETWDEAVQIVNSSK